MQLGCQKAGTRHRLPRCNAALRWHNVLATTLAMAFRSVPVGTIDIHRRFDVDSAASDQPMATLLNLTACYGVIEADAAHAAVACGYAAAVRRWVTRGLT